MTHQPGEAPWHRRSGESEEAHEAFQEFLKHRKVSAAARALGKGRNLLTKWAKKHGWRERARLFDNEQRRRDEGVVREEREASLRRTVDRLEQILELVVARLSRIARRDPSTGEIVFEPKLTPAAATSLLRTVFSILDQRSAQSPAREEDADPDAVLRRRATAELERLLEGLAETPPEEEEENVEPPAPTP